MSQFKTPVNEQAKKFVENLKAEQDGGFEYEYEGLARVYETRFDGFFEELEKAFETEDAESASGIKLNLIDLEKEFEASAIANTEWGKELREKVSQKEKQLVSKHKALIDRWSGSFDESEPELPPVPAPAAEIPETQTPEKEKSVLRVYAQTKAKQGLTENQDAIFIDKQTNTYAVFDGVGGNVGGDRASALAKEYFTKQIGEIPDDLPAYEVEKELTQILSDASKDMAHNLGDAATTAAAVKIINSPEGRKAVIAYSGDSRVYMLREGKLEQLTEDEGMYGVDEKGNVYLHPYSLHVESENMYEIAESLKRKTPDQARALLKSLDEVSISGDLDPESKFLFKRRNMIQNSLGAGFLGPKTRTVDINEGDQIVITSDGIHDNLTSAEILEQLNSGMADPAEELIEAAGKRSREGVMRSKADDMSAIVVEIPVKEKQSQPDTKLDNARKRIDEYAIELNRHLGDARSAAANNIPTSWHEMKLKLTEYSRMIKVELDQNPSLKTNQLEMLLSQVPSVVREIDKLLEKPKTPEHAEARLRERLMDEMAFDVREIYEAEGHSGRELERLIEIRLPKIVENTIRKIKDKKKS